MTFNAITYDNTVIYTFTITMSLVYSENIDIFSKGDVDSSIDSEFFIEYLPTSSLKSSSDFISFEIHGDGSKYRNLSKTKLKVSC